MSHHSLAETTVEAFWDLLYNESLPDPYGVEEQGPSLLVLMRESCSIVRYIVHDAFLDLLRSAHPCITILPVLIDTKELVFLHILLLWWKQ